MTADVLVISGFLYRKTLVISIYIYQSDNSFGIITKWHYHNKRFGGLNIYNGTETTFGGLNIYNGTETRGSSRGESA